METIRFELKYCERCGTLKLRLVASEKTYCQRCEHVLARFVLSRDSGDAKARALGSGPAHGLLAGLQPPVAKNLVTGRVQ